MNVVSRVTAELEKLEKRELEEEELMEEAQRQLEVLQQRVRESQSRLKRFRLQKRSLQTRGVDMVNRGLRSLDELEESERAESEAAVEAMATGHVDVVDWNAVFDGLSAGDAPSGIPVGFGGSSSGA